ncbi:MAG: hypothetical protein MRY78_15965 [Saprospiraceae bacterium]|nr:hypothetical protein [Saprospiraceae bacterium]
MNAIVKAGLKYFLFFCLIYGSLTAISLIPQVGQWGNAMYRPATERILQSVFQKAYIKLKAKPNDVSAIQIEYASKAKVQENWQIANAGGSRRAIKINGKIYEFDFYKTFFSFYIFFVALMLLSPLPRTELAISLLVGSILYYLFSVFRVVMPLAFFLNQPEVDIYHASDFSMSIIKNVNYYLTIGVNLLVVLILWIGLAFRKNNWQQLLRVS